MKRKLPIGLSDFREVIEDGYYYIDKSLFIRELIDIGSKSILLPRPRRFGKTLNLSMLRYFYERTTEDTSKLFQHLSIWREGEAYTAKQGRHPVIFLTFKDVKWETWQACANEMNRVIGEEYRRHRAILQTDMLDSDERERYLAIIEQRADMSSYSNSLKQLSLWLNRFYGEKTVILIDEYDTPIQQGFLHGYYDEVITFMRNLLSGALKDNVSLEKGVLTGILRVAKESIFSGLNNLEVCTLIQKPFSTRFGLMEGEVEQLLADCDVETEADEVKSWYNGYRFGGTTIYNPWSIINFCSKWREGLQPYWINTSSNDLVRQLITESNGELKEELEQMLGGVPIRKPIDDNMVFRDIHLRSHSVWSFLLFSGYLKVERQDLIEGIHYGELMIPNKEVEVLYKQIISGWFETGLTERSHQQMLNALVGGDMMTFESIFRDFVTHAFSLFDTGGGEPEKVYHAFVLGLLVSLRDSYEVKSNRESGYGRYVVMLIPRSPRRQDRVQNGVIIEFKKARGGETLEQAVAAALKQIEDKDYASELRERGVQHVIKLGIAFEGKRLFMKAE
ncbi:PD-(D/E)XK nuclease superfamily protein [Paenibacillus sp. UNCCL117]|uniref:AAA family ATPase n=1 Tax=unclassified Paenibacillus TaxID=185978 RepID=UPI00088ABBBB|nr:MULTISPECIES: AAA family ATPase [unclassified Paenibacillus]SDC17196.1 PD-(D/E)XK nuclease superfamily protein [Paenibacillus sp. cl123]SFW17956.1 PD-(D/E)XK nuclease superfamily protein [Paenibacillus sp. UNCCL117]